MQNKMADDDEIDVLGDFTHDKCTTRPENNLTKNTFTGNNKSNIVKPQTCTEWTIKERELLQRGMEIYGRDAKCLSQFILTKSETEIQLLIEQEFGIILDENLISLGITCNISDKNCASIKSDFSSNIELVDAIPDPVEEVVCVENNYPNIKIKRKSRSSKNMAKSGFNDLTKFKGSGNIKNEKTSFNPRKSNKSVQGVCDTGEPLDFNKDVLYYKDDIVLGNIKYAVTKSNKTETHNKYSRRKCKVSNKGNSNIADECVKRQKNISSGDSKSQPKAIVTTVSKNQKLNDTTSHLQIVTGSGQALPVSEGEQVIKIDKNKCSDNDSDIEVDIESDDTTISPVKNTLTKPYTASNYKIVKQSETQFAIDKVSGKSDVPIVTNTSKEVKDAPSVLGKRRRKLVLDGAGGYTITHSDLGDIYEIGQEPKAQYSAKKQAIGLVHCKSYTREHPAPYHVVLSTSALILMDVHSHTSRAEVMGLLGGKFDPELETLYVDYYAPCEILENSGVHCDMCPVSQSLAYEKLVSKGLEIVGWFHSHPRFPPHPSAQDITSQIDMQAAFKADALSNLVPFVGVIISPHWAPGRTSSQYRCLCVERDYTNSDIVDIPYKFSVNLKKDINYSNVSELIKCVAALNVKARNTPKEFSVDMNNDICPDANLTYLNKCISSVHHHLHSSGYNDNDEIQTLVLKALKDIFL